MCEDPSRLEIMSMDEGLMKQRVLTLLMVFKIRLYLRVFRGYGMTSWNAFLMGCHHRVGEDSNVIRISRCYPALKRIYDYVVPSSLLKKQAIKLMRLVHKSNKHIIPAFFNSLEPLNRESFSNMQSIIHLGKFALGDDGLAFLSKSENMLDDLL